MITLIYFGSSVVYSWADNGLADLMGSKPCATGRILITISLSGSTAEIPVMAVSQQAARLKIMVINQT